MTRPEGRGDGPGTRPGRADRLAEAGKLLEVVETTDFLQAVSLLHTAAWRTEDQQAGASGRKPPPISCTRQAILNLPLNGYRAQADRAEEGFRRARQFLWREKVFGPADLPYRTQLVPLAVILVACATLAAAACGGDDNEVSASTQWAGDLCTAVNTWRNSIATTASQLTSNPTRAGLEQAAADA